MKNNFNCLQSPDCDAECYLIILKNPVFLFYFSVWYWCWLRPLGGVWSVGSPSPALAMPHHHHLAFSTLQPHRLQLLRLSLINILGLIIQLQNWSSFTSILYHHVTHITDCTLNISDISDWNELPLRGVWPVLPDWQMSRNWNWIVFRILDFQQ